jgi:hypothetical protein
MLNISNADERNATQKSNIKALWVVNKYPYFY